MDILTTVLHYLVMWGIVAPAFACLIGWLGLITPAVTNLVLVGYAPSPNVVKRLWMETVMFPLFTVTFVIVLTVSGVGTIATLATTRR